MTIPPNSRKDANSLRDGQRAPKGGHAWPPSAQALLIVLIGGAAVYLISNHWLHILDALPYLGVVLMMSMHLFMHGGRGGHGGHGGHGSASRPRPRRGGGVGHVH